ncbi:MAG: hypothetical protein ACI4Q8_01925 [Ruminococcus sp.]
MDLEEQLRKIENDTELQINRIYSEAEKECRKIIQNAWNTVHKIEFAEREKLSNRLNQLKTYKEQEETRIRNKLITEHILEKYLDYYRNLDEKFLLNTLSDSKRQQLSDKIYEILFNPKE